LNADELAGIVDSFTSFEVKFNYLPSSLHTCIEILRLGVTFMQSGKRNQAIAVLIALDYGHEFPIGFH
jgi:hypothetical protein